MEYKLVGRLNPVNSLVGNLNIYTMETGDGRDIELTIIDNCICWRRVNDTEWVILVSLENLKGDSPIKGIDYWNSEDQEAILEYVRKSIGDDIPHNNLIGRDSEDAHPMSSITGLVARLDKIQSDKSFIFSQSSASAKWRIFHSMNKYPAITVIDSANNTVVGEINYLNLNEVEITFTGAFSGKAYLN